MFSGYSELCYRMHGNRGDGIIVRWVVLYEEVGADIPHLHRAICTARRQAVPFGMKCHAVHSTAPHNA